MNPLSIHLNELVRLLEADMVVCVREGILCSKFLNSICNYTPFDEIH